MSFFKTPPTSAAGGGACHRHVKLHNTATENKTYLSMRSHRKSNVWTASSLSSLRGSQLNQRGRTRFRFTHSGWNLMTFPTAEMQFSVALTFSLERASAAWMTPTSRGMASGGRGRRLFNPTGSASLPKPRRPGSYLCRRSGSSLLRTEP